MEKSIETIWKKGFLNEQEFKAPAVNNFFERKSLLIVDTLITRAKFEFGLLFPIMGVTFFLSLFLGNNPWWSFIGILPFIPWFIIARTQINSMESIPADDNCLVYMRRVQKEVKRILRYNLRATVISVVVTLFPMLVYTYAKHAGETIGEIMGWDGVGLNALWLFSFIPICMVISYFMFKFIHRMSNGTEQRLDELIKDLEGLKEA